MIGNPTISGTILKGAPDFRKPPCMERTFRGFRVQGIEPRHAETHHADKGWAKCRKSQPWLRKEKERTRPHFRKIKARNSTTRAHRACGQGIASQLKMRKPSSKVLNFCPSITLVPLRRSFKKSSNFNFALSCTKCLAEPLSHMPESFMDRVLPCRTGAGPGGWSPKVLFQ